MNNFSQSKEILGTIVELELYSSTNNLEEIANEFWLSAKKFEEKFSRFKTDSDLSIMNRKCGSWQKVSTDMQKLLKEGLYFNRLTHGYFNIGMESLLVKSGYDKNYTFKEKSNYVSGISNIEIAGDEKVLISHPVEFGGFGKGLLLDMAKMHFAMIESVCVNAGGDIYCKNYKEKILFENPFNLDQAIGWAVFEEKFLTASSSNRRNWKGTSHLINPFSNKKSDLMAVHIQADNGISADALSTALFVMGWSKALEFIDECKADFEAMLIGDNGKIHLSKGFRINFYT